MEVIAEGKTKKILAFPGDIARNIVKIVSKEDITAKDGLKRDKIVGKAEWANNTTCNVFELLKKHQISTHFIRRDEEPNAFLAWACRMIPIEVVARRIATGSYLKRHTEVEEGTVFDDVRIEFFLKDDARHDPIIIISDNGQWELHQADKPITKESLLEYMPFTLDNRDVNDMNRLAKIIFEILEKEWKKLNIILWDFKIEFGRLKSNNRLAVADVIDNDSWRIRTREGKQLDKQLYRDGHELEEVKSVYELVSKLTNLFSYL